ncbi:uncharacterized protein N7503_007872 [Penicillium pulvis]|uniref:uncharacterized protein n=1 Tax=Penicillium pulvis TaxID=1562058 RepID=UPI002548ED33|nr:uncharacterized protein N7503_007872 [Penicillium pulvis]KAJ5798576.1 hypothetical protein N7503_007872 [Penicillium pulvis]
MQGTVFIHQGPYESIPETASPGLRFLSRFLPAVDSVNPTQDPVDCFFKSNASIIIGSNPSKPVQSATHFESRSRFLSHFHRHIHMAWDMDLTNTNIHTVDLNTIGESQHPLDRPRPETDAQDPYPLIRYSVMFEATSETIFKDDPDQFLVKTREFNVLELEGTSHADLKIIQMRVFFDAKPIQARAASLTKSSAYGESQRET